MEDNLGKTHGYDTQHFTVCDHDRYKKPRHPTVQRKLELVHERFNSVMLKVINGCYGNEFIYICMEGLLGQTEKAEPFEVMA